MFWFVGWIFFGLVVGLIARGVMPGEQPMGLFKTMASGCLRVFCRWTRRLLHRRWSLVQSSGWIGSVIGAVVVLALQLRRSSVENGIQAEREQ